MFLKRFFNFEVLFFKKNLKKAAVLLNFDEFTLTFISE